MRELIPLYNIETNIVCRDWDLWGPLVLCLILGILLSVNVSTCIHSLWLRINCFEGSCITISWHLHQCCRNYFRGVFGGDCSGEGELCSHFGPLGIALIQRQCKLLGGRVYVLLHHLEYSLSDLSLSRSFFQGLCAFGYCVAPLNVAALVATFVHLIYVRVPVALAAWAWCIWGELPSVRLYNPVIPSCVFRSICEFLGRNQDRKAENTSGRISPSVSFH